MEEELAAMSEELEAQGDSDLEESEEDSAPETKEAVKEAVNEAVNKAVTADEQKIIDEIKANSKVSQNMIAKKTGFSRSKVQRLMKNMIERKIIHRIGADKNGYWEIQ